MSSRLGLRSTDPAPLKEIIAPEYGTKTGTKYPVTIANQLIVFHEQAGEKCHYGLTEQCRTEHRPEFLHGA